MFTPQDWDKCLLYWENQCCICGQKAKDGYIIAQEHWIPLADKRDDNPGTVPWNILPMCHARSGVSGGCNNSKWKREPVSWLESRLGAEQAQLKLTKITEYFSSVEKNAVTPPVMQLLVERALASL